MKTNDFGIAGKRLTPEPAVDDCNAATERGDMRNSLPSSASQSSTVPAPTLTVGVRRSLEHVSAGASP